MHAILLKVWNSNPSCDRTWLFQEYYNWLHGASAPTLSLNGFCVCSTTMATSSCLLCQPDSNLLETKSHACSFWATPGLSKDTTTVSSPPPTQAWPPGTLTSGSSQSTFLGNYLFVCIIFWATKSPGGSMKWFVPTCTHSFGAAGLQGQFIILSRGSGLAWVYISSASHSLDGLQGSAYIT